MSALDPELWRKLSPYLDRALDLAEAERPAWLAALRSEDAELAEQLEALLEELRSVGRAGFLEGRPAMLPGQAARAGEMTGAYRLIEPIGHGGMGTVWVAERSDGRFDRHVAVKFPNVFLTGRAGERFEREGRILARLTHPSIAQLVDAGVSEAGQPFLVLEYVEGEPIDRYCDIRALSVEARLRLFLAVLGAVAHAHASLVVHRDIKPSNVLVAHDGNVKLLDFGIAKLLGDEIDGGAATVLTREAGVGMTPEYAAPEQMTGGAITTATDVYALGVLLYGLLTGAHPAGSTRSSPAELVKAVVEIDPVRPSDAVARHRFDSDTVDGESSVAARRASSPEKLRRQLRGDLDTILLKALKKDPRERYVSVAAFAEDLHRTLAHVPISAHADAVSYRAAKFVRRNRLAVALAALGILATSVGLAGTLIQARTARLDRDFALRQLARAEYINDLNGFLLSDAAPSGESFTVNDLLTRAEHVVARQGGGHEGIRVELLISIGDQYWAQDEGERALRVLNEAYDLSRQLPDRSVRGRAACALARALGPAPEPQRAEALVQEGLRDLPESRQFIGDRIYCLQRGSEAARERGDGHEAIDRAQAARDLLRSSPFESEVLNLSLHMTLAEAYIIAGRLREASSAFEGAALLMAELGRDDTQLAGTLYNDWGLTLILMGRPLDAERALRRAIELGSDHRGDETVSPVLLVNYSRVLRDLGKSDEAAEYAERSYLKSRQLGLETTMDYAMLSRARAYLAQGDLSRAEAMLDEVEPRFRQGLPAGHNAFVALASQRARLAESRGEMAAALEHVDEAVRLVESSIEAGRGGGDYLPIVLMQRSELLVRLQRPEDATADATRALAAFQDAAPPDTLTINLGRGFVALGRALEARGDRSGARDALASALRHLEDAAGGEHPETVAVRELLAAAP